MMELVQNPSMMRNSTPKAVQIFERFQPKEQNFLHELESQIETKKSDTKNHVPLVSTISRYQFRTPFENEK